MSTKWLSNTQPKQSNKILHDIVTLKQELTHHTRFAWIQIIQVNSRRASIEFLLILDAITVFPRSNSSELANNL
ncbi:MAG: hypothetical protein ACRC62_20865 [Microcoleus sp.]